MRNKLKFSPALTENLFLSLLISILIPYLYLSFFCHPVGDDFSYAHLSLKEGLLNGYVLEYFIWSGRYSTNMTMLLNPMTINSIAGYRLVSMLMLVLTAISVVSFFKAWFGEILNTRQIWIAGLLIFSVYLFQTPSLAQAFYWFSGSASYQLGNIFLMFHFVIFTYLIRNKYFINKQVHIGLLALILVISIGFSEVHLLIALVFYGMTTMMSFISKSYLRKVLVLLLSITLLFSIISIFAPGNFARATNFLDNQDLIKSLVFTFLQIIRFFFDWISNIPFILGTLVLIPFARTAVHKIDFIKRNFKLHPVLAFSLLFLLLFIAIFPPYWSTGILGQHRTLNVAYFFFIFLWIFNVFNVVNYYEGKFDFNVFNNKTFIKPVLLLLVFSIATTRNSYVVFLDLFYNTAASFDNEMSERIYLLEDAKKNNVKKLVFEPIKHKPVSLYVLDITNDPEHWINKSYSDYYNVSEIYLKKDCP